ncbi:hypothetical protein KM043_015305 [Ampulex compressa]|nr:hypothetical protein KM043_015305 [Ampulex compressa]
MAQTVSPAAAQTMSPRVKSPVNVMQMSMQLPILGRPASTRPLSAPASTLLALDADKLAESTDFANRPRAASCDPWETDDALPSVSSELRVALAEDLIVESRRSVRNTLVERMLREEDVGCLEIRLGVRFNSF